MIDEEVRDFIQRGIGENDFEVVGLCFLLSQIINSFNLLHRNLCLETYLRQYLKLHIYRVFIIWDHQSRAAQNFRMLPPFDLSSLVDITLYMVLK